MTELLHCIMYFRVQRNCQEMSMEVNARFVFEASGRRRVGATIDDDESKETSKTVPAVRFIADISYERIPKLRCC